MGREENEIKKNKLREYERALRQQKRLEEELEEVRCERILPGIVADGMPHGSKKKNDLAEYMARLEKAEIRLMEAIVKKREIREDIVDRIEKIKSENQKDVLKHRYIDLMSWKEICDSMNYSWKQAHRIHNDALEHIDI